MKNRNKKIFSAMAGLALSGTMVLGAASFAACTNGDKQGNVPNENLAVIDTAMGQVQSRASGKVYYVSPTGQSTNDGSYAKPYEIAYLLGDDRSPLAAGDTVYVLPGTYSITQTVTMRKNGTYDKFIRVLNAGLTKDNEDNEYTGNDTVVTLSFYNQNFASTARGVQLYGNYTYWYGIDVAGAGDNGFYVGGSFNTVEYGEFYDNRDSGLQLGRQESSHNTMDLWPSYNLIKNCTSHNNYDNETFGENADGFAAKLTIGFGNVFDGCIAYRNSDDGWDLYAKTDSGNIGAVIIYNCVAFENGYLEYDRDTSNNRYPTFDQTKYDDLANKYATRDGDGNGFKLGGSVMEGDVVMYNCLSFQNRMHGVTDNSNPGYLKVEGVTSYDNSAAVDPNTGKVISAKNSDNHGNIDVARQTYSYNTVNGVLSVKSSIAQSLDSDAYRGSVFNSLLNAGDKTNVINGSLDADTKVGVSNTSQIAALVATDVFKSLPVTLAGEEYTYNIDGTLDSRNSEGALLDTRVHHALRNNDESVNMGDVLAMKEDFNYAQYLSLGEGDIFGSTLNKAQWSDYTHFVSYDYNSAKSEDEVRVDKAIESLTINTEEGAVYQDFEVPVEMQGAKISWQSSDTSVLSIGTEVDKSISGSEYITLSVTRDVHEDKPVTLTATVSYGSANKTKTFNLTIKQGTPEIGEIRVITFDGTVLTDGAEIIDQYRIWTEPRVEVTNGLYYTEKVLDPSLYTVEKTYMYAKTSTSYAVEVKEFTPSVAGVYTITNTIKLNDSNATKSMTYTIYVASFEADVDFAGDASVVVNKDGYIISGDLSSATGTIYAVSSATKLTEEQINADNIKTYEGVTSYDFRAVSISEQFSNPNSEGYFIYYALANVNGKVTSPVYEQEVKVVTIDTPDKFMKMAGGSAVSGENPATTIYMLNGDIDFASTTYSVGSESFSGLLNGRGYTVKNVTYQKSGTKNIGLFTGVKNGTIENIKFDNIKLLGTEVVGIVANSYGGYFYNIAVTNVMVSGSQRVGGLIGRATEGALPTYIEQVSVVNTIGDVEADGKINAQGKVPTNYYIQSSGNRAAGVLGFVQTSNIANNMIVKISDCYVSSYITAAGYSVSAICAEYNENGQSGKGYELSLEITHCVTNCVLVATGSSSRIGGMLGYHSSAGVELTITQCLALDKAYYGNAFVAACQKNISGIVGNYQSTAGTVTKCIALIEEHNTNFDVTVYNPTQLSRNKVLFTGEERGILNLDLETKWSFIEKEDNADELEAPYVALNFLDC